MPLVLAGPKGRPVSKVRDIEPLPNRVFISPTDIGSNRTVIPPPSIIPPAAAPYAPPPHSEVPRSEEAQQTAEKVAEQQVNSSIAGQSFAPLLETLHGIGRPTIAPFAPVAPRFEGQAPVPIRRPDSSYYQNLFNAKAMPLGQDYFGRGGLSDQAVAEANRRGLLTAGPSGVAGQLYEKTISNPYAREIANIQNQVNIIQTETELDLAKYDSIRQDEFRQFQANLIEKDREHGVVSVKAQAEIDNTYLSLEAEINDAIARGATSEKLAELNARISTFQSLVDAAVAQRTLNQQSAEAVARLEEDRLRRQGAWWLDALATPGAFSGGEGSDAYEAPFGELDQPRPVRI